jgi:hypothetical protein
LFLVVKQCGEALDLKRICAVSILVQTVPFRKTFHLSKLFPILLVQSIQRAEEVVKAVERGSKTLIGLCFERVGMLEDT